MGALLQIPPLDANSSTPLYRQLYANLRDAIKLGTLRTGDQIPPSREMAQLAGVNRATVAAAYELLEADGLIRGHVGRGSFVQTPPAAQSTPGDGTISFATSRPSADLFPLSEFRQTVQEVLDNPELPALLQLGAPGGYAPLKAALGVPSAADDLLITSGCQQALDLVARTLTAPGDSVLVEDPVYLGLKNAMTNARLRLMAMPALEAPHAPHAMGATDPLDRPAEWPGHTPASNTTAANTLETTLEAIERNRPRLVFVTPDFQNPTGRTLPESARRALGQACARTGTPLVEIDLYRDLRYAGDPIPSIQELVPEAQVLVLRSFSKIAFPGLRVGWVTGPRALIARLTETKQWTDLHTDHFSQAVLLRFVESRRLDRHRKRVVQAGAICLRAALDACERELPRGSRFTRPGGGMNLWVTLPGAIDTAAMLERAQRAGVTYMPGSYFAVEQPQTSSLRLSFAGLAPDQIRQGIAILGRVAADELQRGRTQQLAPAAVAMV